MTVDQHMLQSLSVPVAAVTLRDPTCQAQSNGSHFLLVFPVISCGTEGLLLGHPKGVQYKNKVLLWRDKPRTILALNGTEEKSKSPLGIHEISFSCSAAISSPRSPASDNDDNVNTPQTGLVTWVPEGPGLDPVLSHPLIPRHRSGPVLILNLFVTESYNQRRIGPCVITANHRVYFEISARGPLTDVVEVKSCVVSPLSDPKKSPFWTVISDGCSSDPSLTLGAQTKKGEEEESEGESALEEEKEERKGKDKGYKDIHNRKMERRGRETPARTEKKSTLMGAEEERQSLRFSFIMRPVYNDSMQFLHCSLRLCVSDSTREEPMEEAVNNDCQGGLRIPPLVSRSHRHQCEIRNLSRPMVVTQHISSLAPKLSRPPTCQRTKRLSISPLTSPGPEHSSSVMQTGPVMGIVFAAFVMGVILMGGLWCIYNYTGARPASLGEEGHLTDQTNGGHSIWNSPSPSSDQSTSSV